MVDIFSIVVVVVGGGGGGGVGGGGVGGIGGIGGIGGVVVHVVCDNDKVKFSFGDVDFSESGGGIVPISYSLW